MSNPLDPEMMSPAERLEEAVRQLADWPGASFVAGYWRRTGESLS